MFLFPLSSFTCSSPRSATELAYGCSFTCPSPRSATELAPCVAGFLPQHLHTVLDLSLELLAGCGLCKQRCSLKWCLCNGVRGDDLSCFTSPLAASLWHCVGHGLGQELLHHIHCFIAALLGPCSVSSACSAPAELHVACLCLLGFCSCLVLAHVQH